MDLLLNLLSEVAGGAHGPLLPLALVGIAYSLGFLVVNLHLGRFGIVRFDLLHARFMAAGVLFMLLSGLATLFATIPTFLCSFTLDFARRVYQGARTALRIVNSLPRRSWQRWLLVFACILVTLLAFAAVLPIEIWAAQLVVELLKLLLHLLDTPLNEQVVLALRADMARLYILLGATTGLLVLLSEQIKFFPLVIRRPTAAAASILILCAFTYCALWYTGVIYPTLPASVGGGLASTVRFSVKPENLPEVKALGLPLAALAELESDNLGAIDGVVHETLPECVPLLARPSETLIVLLCSDGQCNALEFNRELVSTIIHCSDSR